MSVLVCHPPLRSTLPLVSHGWLLHSFPPSGLRRQQPAVGPAGVPPARKPFAPARPGPAAVRHRWSRLEGRNAVCCRAWSAWIDRLMLAATAAPDRARLSGRFVTHLESRSRCSESSTRSSRHAEPGCRRRAPRRCKFRLQPYPMWYARACETGFARADRVVGDGRRGHLARASSGGQGSGDRRAAGGTAVPGWRAVRAPDWS